MSSFIKGLITGIAVCTLLIVLVIMDFSNDHDNQALIYQYREGNTALYTDVIYKRTNVLRPFPGLKPDDQANNFHTHDEDLKPSETALFYIAPQTPGVEISWRDIEKVCLTYQANSWPDQDILTMNATIKPEAEERMFSYFEATPSLGPFQIIDAFGTQLSQGRPDPTAIKRIRGQDPYQNRTITFDFIEADFSIVSVIVLSWAGFNPAIPPCDPDTSKYDTDWFKSFLAEQANLSEEEITSYRKDYGHTG